MKLANDMVISRFPIALLVMIIATLMLFGSVRQMLVTWMTVPLIMVGVFVGTLCDRPLSLPSQRCWVC
jgi:multidrug efflux pump subunit AcrB